MPGGIIAAVTPLISLVAGFVALVTGALILRSFGPRYRVGRLLASTPEITVGEALAHAAGPSRYVRIAGRIDSEHEFEDDAHRPLVFRRTRLALRRGRTWTDIDDRRETAAFTIDEGLDSIAVDVDALADGLIVVPREAVGVASDALDRVPEGTDPDAALRLRIEHVSSVEHAVALGVPRIAAGMPILTAGLGRPLILTTLDQPDAMRLLTEGSSWRPVAAAVALVGGAGLVAIGALLAVVEAVT